MLELKNIKKVYETSGNRVYALKNINIKFRKNEFVSILGASGCGKTTLLNIIGGLDKYTSGDLIINGVSTKEFKDSNWDTYRNHSIGFVFQNYNLIPHQTVLENVMLSLKLNGNTNSKKCRREAKNVLVKVGLGDKISYKPNQLSGGQCQRVAIARALVNNPDIILADEPTGSLDSKTSIQIMDILKEISKEKLVIIVTHNPELANNYSTRIIKIKDGIIEQDSMPFTKFDKEIQDKKLRKKNKSHMPFKVSFMLSLKNLLSKKRRTFITCFAGSIGIIGISTILSVSSGMSDYVKQIESDSTSFNYLIIQNNYTDMKSLVHDTSVKLDEYTNKNIIYNYDDNLQNKIVKQNLSSEYVDYIENNTKDLVVDVKYNYNIKMNFIYKNKDLYKNVTTANFSEMLDNKEHILRNYDILSYQDKNNKLPNKYNEIAIVLDKYNRLSNSIIEMFGLDYNNKIEYKDILGKEIKLVNNNDYYQNKFDLFIKPSTNEELKNSYEKGISLKVVSIIRKKDDNSNEYLQAGITYTKALTDYVFENNINSDIVKAQLENKEKDVTTGINFSSNIDNFSMIIQSTYEDKLNSIGAVKNPSSIIIYPKDYDSKDKIINILDDWNKNNKDHEIKYTDISNIVITMLDSIINIVSYVLIAFSSISLVVSSIMISIVIYNSVIERIKEIGILRAMGARKKDVSRVFKSEAIIMGMISGIVALIITYIICCIINSILTDLINVSKIANLTFNICLSMIILSVFLTFTSSLIPAKIAAKKDPVVAFRNE